MKVKWEDPPARTCGGGGKEAEVVDALKQRPGIWARVADGFNTPGSASSRAQSIRRFAERNSVPVEAVSRKVGAKWAVWARVVLSTDTDF